MHYAAITPWVAGSIREVSGNLYPGIRAVLTYPGDYGSTRIRVSGQKAGRAWSLCIQAEQTIREEQSGQNKPSGYPGETWASKQTIGASWDQLVPASTQLVPAGYQLVPAGSNGLPGCPGFARIPGWLVLPGLVLSDRLVLPRYIARKVFQLFARIPGYV